PRTCVPPMDMLGCWLGSDGTSMHVARVAALNPAAYLTPTSLAVTVTSMRAPSRRGSPRGGWGEPGQLPRSGLCLLCGVIIHGEHGGAGRGSSQSAEPFGGSNLLPS